MRRKMARAVEGCLYSRMKVVPGSFSRYSKEARVETDILVVPKSQVSSCYRFIIVRNVVILFLEALRSLMLKLAGTDHF